jgi:hypothetical protein
VTSDELAGEQVREAFATGAVLDLDGAEVPAALLAGLLAAAPAGSKPGIPALRMVNAMVRGALALPGASVTALVECIGCTFDAPLDLYAADVAGIRLTRCTLPGMYAANVRVRSELALESCTLTGPCAVPDARVAGPVRLTGTSLQTPGGYALIGVRLVVRGVLDAKDLRAHGELRLAGARVDGNIDVRGAQLAHPGGDALQASGVQVGGNLRSDRLHAQGRIVLAGAVVAGNAVFSGAMLHGTTDPDEHAVLVLPRGGPDPSAALVADRLQVRGNLVLDAGFTATGTVRLTNAQVGGYVQLSGARAWAALCNPVPPMLISPARCRWPWRPMVSRCAGDLDARPSTADGQGALQAYGQVRLVGARIQGSASLSGATLHGPGLDVLFADRLQVGGSLFLRRVTASGSIRLHHAHIGSTLDCTAAQLDTPRRRPDGTIKPSLDARAATIGKDLYASRGFTAAGGVRVSLAEVSKSISFDGARLGGPGTGVVALRAPGMRCQELNLRFAAPPWGDVSLAGAVVGAVFDSEQLWATQGSLDIEDF